MVEARNDVNDVLIHPALGEDLDASESSIVESFPWRRVVLPRSAIAAGAQQPLLRGLLPTDIGSFTHASRHFCLRESGSKQAIFAYCVSGCGWFDVGHKRIPVRAGELLVLRPGTPHAYAADPRDAWTIHWFHATGRHIPDFLQELDVGETARVIQLGPDPALIALFQEALSVVEQGHSSTQLLQASHILGHLLSLFVAKSRQFWRHEPDSVQAVAATIDFMRTHLHQPLSVRTLAAQANLSTSHYSALFKRQTGYAPIDYFTRLRMHRAGRLLETSQHSVKAIAAMFGYEDPTYFSRVFRQLNEVSPSEYRRVKRGRKDEADI